MNPLTWWKNEYGEAAPVGHVLRLRYSEDWIRFHSLPESKRYPDSEQEMDEVLRRAATVATSLFETGEAIYLYISRCLHEDEQVPAAEEIAGEVTEAGSVTLWANHGDVPPEEDDAFATWARSDAWPPSYFSNLIRQVANEEARFVCLVSPKSGNIFCPYDGGIDVFCSSPEVHEPLKFLRGWRSQRSDGL
ncbi:MAG: hypothetical protein ING37_08655 [Rhodocyclaceae bacterium]|nr:hypothetical protein [Rhodocyclaceae bacterium]MCA3052529.1 hypothetical protein [Rhodocyclaceae bacterium]